jgi:hypothetical protein
MEAQPTFDIFRGPSEGDAEWIEAVPGLSDALHRMEELAALKPGQYFLFESRTRSTLVKIDSRKSLLRSLPEEKAEIA